MSTRFPVLMRQCRGPLVAVMVALLALQSLVAGLATAQAASHLMAVPSDAVCHGAGADHGAPDSQPARGVCCVTCTAATPALLPIMPRLAGCMERTGKPSLSPSVADTVSIGPRTVRAGPSQAPPRFA